MGENKEPKQKQSCIAFWFDETPLSPQWSNEISQEIKPSTLPSTGTSLKNFHIE